MSNLLTKILKRGITVSVLLFLCVTLNAQSLNLSFKNTRISDILTEITEQTGYEFAYSNVLKEIEQKVDFEYKSTGIETALNRLFEGRGIVFEIKGKQVILAPANMAGSVPAQKVIPVKGVVRDEFGEPVPGVVIKARNSDKYAVTEADGSFSMASVPSTAILDVTSMGMKSLEVPVNGRQMIELSMAADVVALEDVVVTGYQTLSKERATGSFSVVSSEKIQNKLQADVKSVLEGQSAGVVLTKDGDIEIRGVSTISGVKTPLIVVDGYPLIGEGLGLESINPDIIENVTVLKDAVAASIYGSRASNGVIVVTTKKAKEGTFSVSYKGRYSVTLKPDLDDLHMASVEDYMDAELQLYNESPNGFYSDYNGYYLMSDYQYILMAMDNGLMSRSDGEAMIEQLKNNNVLDEIQKYLLRPKQSHQHNVSLMSGTEKNQFSASMRYAEEFDNLPNNKNTSMIFDINNTWSPVDWFNFRLLANITYNKDYATVETIETYTSFDSKIFPYTNMYDDNGNAIPWEAVGQRRIDTYHTYPGMKSVYYHPETDLPLNMTTTNNLQIRLGGDMNVKFTKWLTGSFGGSWVKGSNGSRTVYDGESFKMRTAYNDATSQTNPTMHYLPEGGMITENRGTIDTWVLRGQLNYNQSFDNDKHRITAMLGTEISKDTYETVYMPSRVGYNSVSASYNSGFNALDYNNNANNMSGDMLFGRKPVNLYSVSMGSNYAVRDNRFVSWYGNASYELMNKYILSGSVRLDLTNFFGTDPKFRYKPTWSVGGTWKISEEDFFAGAKDVVDRLYLRASYGINGNISLNNTPYLILSVGSYDETMGGVSYGISSYPNNQLRWERTQIFDVAFDLSMFNNRLNATVDFYNKLSTDLIASDEVDETTGTSSLTQNVGSLRNTGFEVALGGDIIRNSNFVWNSNLIASYNTSKVLKYNIARSYFTSYGKATGLLVEGYPMDGFWGARFSRIDETGTALYFNAAGEEVAGGSLKAADAIYLGTSRPPLDMSWTNSFKFGNFEASIMFIGKFGAKYRKDAFVGSNYNNRYVGQRWREPGDEAYTIYPKLKSWNMDMFYYPYSDHLIASANYVKLRDLTFSYNLPQKAVKKIGLSNLKFYFQTRNLFYITAKGVDIDPEVMELNTGGGTGAMTNQAFASLPLRPEFYFGVQINL